MTPRSYKLPISRLQLSITEWGDPTNPPLILQHGGRDHGRSWDQVAEAFALTHRVIVPDLRGHGDSDWVSDGSYDLLGLVEDFTHIVRTLDLPPCAMVAHSLGANIVTRFAGLYPDQVTRLVSIEGLGDMPEAVQREVARDPLDRLRGWIELRSKLGTRRASEYPDFAALVARMMTTDTRITPDFAQHLARHAARANPDGTLRLKHDPAIVGYRPVDIAPEALLLLWKAITCPLLLVYGADSWASNPALDGRAAHFQDARVELFENAGHWVHHDRCNDFILMVKAFLS